MSDWKNWVKTFVPEGDGYQTKCDDLRLSPAAPTLYQCKSDVLTFQRPVGALIDAADTEADAHTLYHKVPTALTLFAHTVNENIQC